MLARAFDREGDGLATLLTVAYHKTGISLWKAAAVRTRSLLDILRDLSRCAL